MIRYLQSRAYLVCNPFATLQMGDCAIFKINYNSSSLLRMQNTSYIQLIYAPSNFAWIHRLFVTTGMCYNGGCCFCETSVASKCLREFYGIGPRARTMVTRITAGRHFACNFLTILIVSTSYNRNFGKGLLAKDIWSALQAQMILRKVCLTTQTTRKSSSTCTNNELDCCP